VSRSGRYLAIVVAAVMLWILPALLPSDYFVTFGARLLALAVLAGSFNLLMSYLALSSFGHSALFGVGGYAVGMLFKMTGNVDAALAVLSGFAGGALVAGILGPIVLRATGVYFILLSLAVGQVLWGVADSWRSVTGGSDGLILYATPQLGSWSLAEPVATFRVTALVALAAVLMLHVVVRSAFGIALTGVRDSEIRMLALGYNIFRLRYLAFVLAGAFAGLSGALVAMVNRFVSPDAMSVRMAVELVLIVILGGRGRFWGPLGAAVLLFAAEEAISIYTSLWPLVLGMIFIVAVYVLRFGLLRIPSRPGQPRGTPAAAERAAVGGDGR
jgi:branched-chain amino acid transport system permease protein